MSYGPKQSEIGELAAGLVARILQGARPADLPLELPTRFEFLVNLKTAKLLAIALPSTLVARADEVIEQRSILLRCMSPLLALSGHGAMSKSCPLSGGKADMG